MKLKSYWSILYSCFNFSCIQYNNTKLKLITAKIQNIAVNFHIVFYLKYNTHVMTYHTLSKQIPVFTHDSSRLLEEIEQNSTTAHSRNVQFGIQIGSN